MKMKSDGTPFHKRFLRQRRQNTANGDGEGQHRHHSLKGSDSRNSDSSTDSSDNSHFSHHHGEHHRTGTGADGFGGGQMTGTEGGSRSQQTGTLSSPNNQQGQNNQPFANMNGNHTVSHRPLSDGSTPIMHSHSNTGKSVGIAVGAVVGGFFLILFAVIGYMFFRRKRESAERQKQLDASIAAGGFRSSMGSTEEMKPVKLNSAGQSRSDLMKKIDRQTRWIYGPEGTPEASAEVGRQGDAGWNYAHYLGAGSLASASDENHSNVHKQQQQSSNVQMNNHYTSQDRLVNQEPETQISYLQDGGSDEDHHYAYQEQQYQQQPYQQQQQQRQLVPPQYSPPHYR